MARIAGLKKAAVIPAILTLALGPGVFAQAPGPEAYAWSWGFAGVHRFDDLRWTIADGDGSPNILSELIWHDIWAAGAEGRISAARRRLLLECEFSLAFIYHGMNQDSDYLGDDRTGEFSRSNNRSDGGMLWRASGGAGRLFALEPTWIELVVLAGFSVHGQNLTMTDGYQTISLDNDPPVGPFDGLDSTYRSRWIGPWVGASLRMEPSEVLSAGFRFLYHLGLYYAWANWNLRDDFAHPKSFEHMAIGNGLDMRGGLSVGKELQLAVEAAYQYWFTSRGIDRTFFSSGFYTVIPLNGVRWRTLQLSASLRYRIP